MKAKKTSCKTITGYTEDGEAILKDKHKYDTHEKAVIACKTLNLQNDHVKKLVTYKCNVCYKFHIGRNGSSIDEKYKKRVRKQNNLIGESRMRVGIKVVGKIDLTNLR